MTGPPVNQCVTSIVDCSEVPLHKGSNLTMGRKAVYNYLEALLRLGSNSFKAELARLDQHTEELARSVRVRQVPLPSVPDPEVRTPNNNQPRLLLPKPSTTKSTAPSIRIPQFRKQRRLAMAMRQTQPAGTRRKPALHEIEIMEVDPDSSTGLETTVISDIRLWTASMYTARKYRRARRQKTTCSCCREYNLKNHKQFEWGSAITVLVGPVALVNRYFPANIIFLLVNIGHNIASGAHRDFANFAE
ncbi:hypothetical protein CSKR_110514 [Clonorchis sinensis]|uniref:Uncharacterized protein n=1 Tax=Clonorchis sinensis TaxID=79923 RepID=A0A419PEC6_CLOSI|nr:hypothetical protein CSKR_110514 [Clonorchis sinensis]